MMELDDLKSSWESVNKQIEQQPKLTPKIIDQMTQTTYYSSLRSVNYPEMIGMLICLIGASYIGLNLYKLDTTFLLGVGILAILLLVSVSVISLMSIGTFIRAGNVNRPHSETLKRFARQKIKFQKLQKVNVTLSYLLMVLTIILLSKFFGGKDITGNKYFWIFSFTFGYIFLLFYSRWVLKYYNKTLRQAEELLQELQQ